MMTTSVVISSLKMMLPDSKYWLGDSSDVTPSQ